MLGIGNIVTAGSKVANVVRRGLQAWYKADDTQAPLGEEQIVNGNFGLGPELVTNGSFIGVADGTASTWVDGPEEGWRAYGDPISRNIVNEQLVIVTDASENDGVRYDVSGAKAGEIYKIQLDVLEGAGGSNVHSNNPNASLNVSSATPENPTKTFYKTIEDDGAFSVYFRGPNNSAGTAIYDNISIKKANPNDSWVTAHSVAGADEIIFEDGRAKMMYGSSGSTSPLGMYQTALTQGRKYKAKLTVTEVTPGSGHLIKLFEGSNLIQANIGAGTHEIDFTCAGDGKFWIYRNGTSTDTEVYISDVSVKEITNSVKDFSPNSNDAVLYSGKCLDFSGSSVGERINLNYWKSQAINSNTKTTFALWINRDADGDIALGNEDGSNARFYIGTTSNKLGLGWGSSIWDDSSTRSGTPPDVSNDTWYRVVAVIDGKTCKVYMNGEYYFEKTNASDFTIDSDGVFLGSQGPESGNDYEWNGQIADLQAYDKAWTETDVKYDWENPDKDVFDGSSNILPTDCKLLYRLNEGSSNRAYNAAPVLGPNIVKHGTFDVADIAPNTVANTSNVASVGWTVYQNNISEIKDGQLILTYNFEVGDNNAKYLGYIYFQDHGTRLTEDLVVGNYYQVKLDLKTSKESSSVRVHLNDQNDGNDDYSETLTTTLKTYTFNLKAGHATNCYIRFDSASAGDVVTVDNLEFREINLSTSTIPVAVEKLTEPSFSAATGWTGAGSNGWDIAGGKATATAAAGSLSQDVLTDGKWYDIEVKFESAQDNGDLTVELGTNNHKIYDDSRSAAYTSTTTKKLTMQCAGNSTFKLTKDASFTGVLLSCSVKEHPNWISAQPYIPQTAMSSYSKKAKFAGEDQYGKSDSTLAAVSRVKPFTVSMWAVINQLPVGGDGEDERRGLFQNSHSASDRNGIMINEDGKICAGHYGDTEAATDVTVTGVSFSGTTVTHTAVAGITEGATVSGTGVPSNATVASITDSTHFELSQAASGGNGTITVGIKNGWTSASSEPIELGKLYHIVWTNNSYTPGGSNNNLLYINGVKQSGTTATYAGSTTGLQVGRNSNTEYADCFIDEVSIFDEVLTQSEISELFNSGIALDTRDHSKYLGSELITDNTWTFEAVDADNTINGVTSLGSNTSSDGSFRFITESSNSAIIDIKKSSFIEVDHYYELSYDITSSNHNTGLATYTVYAGNQGAVQQTLNTNVGSHKLNFYSKNDFLIIKRNANGIDITISNISLKKINLHGYWRNNGVQNWGDLSVYNQSDIEIFGSPNTIHLQEVPYFKKDTLGFPMNRVRERGFNLDRSGYIRIDNDSSFDCTTTNEITVEAWVKKIEQNTGDAYIFANANWGTTGGFALVSNDTLFTWAPDDGSDNWVGHAHSDSPNWHHVACTFDESISRIYVNGTEMNTNDADDVMTYAGNDVFIGVRPSDQLANFEGVIDDVKMYNRVLTSSEIKRNYNATKSAHSSTSSWSDDFDENFV